MRAPSKYDPAVTKIKEHNAQIFRETTAIIKNGYYIAPSGARVDLHMQPMLAGQRCYHKELDPVQKPKVDHGTQVLVVKESWMSMVSSLIGWGLLRGFQ